MSKLYNKINSLCKMSNITIGKMCSECKIRRSILTDLKMGRTKTLSTTTLSKIAVFFGTTVDRLIDNDLYQAKSDRENFNIAFKQKEKPGANSDEFTPDEIEFLSKVSQLDEDGRKLALAQLDALLGVYKDKKNKSDV